MSPSTSSGASTSYKQIGQVRQHSIRSASYHRRSGVLKTSPENMEINAQRSRALYQSVLQGEISLDDILAMPVDWQGIAMEEQWRKDRTLAGEETIPTRSPLAVKTKSHSHRQEDNYTASAFLPSPLSSSSSTNRASQSSSDGLCLSLHSPKDEINLDPPAYNLFPEEAYFERSPTPLEQPLHLSMPSTPSSDSSDFSVATPTSYSPMLFEQQDTKFDLTSYCSAFNDSERFEQVW
ncbi:hypothetical protein CBS101457_003981 [Exobasidium rhododendri]|nr:hypothetical protein CBS101457_003981 [Exobasidium rhododendri]